MESFLQGYGWYYEGSLTGEHSIGDMWPVLMKWFVSLYCKGIFDSLVSSDSDSPSPLVVCLPNCRSDPVISLDRVLERMKQLEQSLSFKKVHEQFASGDYSTVVDKLLPLLDQDAESASMIEVCVYTCTIYLCTKNYRIARIESNCSTPITEWYGIIILFLNFSEGHRVYIVPYSWYFGEH